MSASFNHLITAVVNPYMIGLLVLCASRFVGVRWKRTGRGLFVGGFAWIWFWSTGLSVNWAGSSLEKDYPPANVESYPAADVIHILGGGMAVNTNDCVYPEMSGNADRVWMGAKLFRAGKAPLVVCSGGGVAESTLPLLEDLGVSREVIKVLIDAKNTEDEGRMIADLVGASNKVLLVTSSWHMRRAEMLFRKNCPCKVIPVPCDFETTTRFGKSHAFSFRDLIPSADSMCLSCIFFKEHFASRCYKWLKGY